MDGQFVMGTAMIVATVTFHVFCLVWLANILRYMGVRTSSINANFRSMMLMAFAVLGLIAIHTIEAWSWETTFCGAVAAGRCTTGIIF